MLPRVYWKLSVQTDSVFLFILLQSRQHCLNRRAQSPPCLASSLDRPVPIGAPRLHADTATKHLPLCRPAKQWWRCMSPWHRPRHGDIAAKPSPLRPVLPWSTAGAVCRYGFAAAVAPLVSQRSTARAACCHGRRSSGPEEQTPSTNMPTRSQSASASSIECAVRLVKTKRVWCQIGPTYIWYRIHSFGTWSHKFLVPVSHNFRFRETIRFR